MKLQQWRKTFRYDSFTTYSVYREPELTVFLEQQSKKIRLLEEQLKNARYMKQAGLSEAIKLEERRKGHIAIPIRDADGGLHPTAVRFAEEKADSDKGRELEVILNNNLEVDVASGCIPVYRDGIIFHDHASGESKVLSICLECYGLSSDGLDGYAHSSVFRAFAAFFYSCGHPIEDYWMDVLRAK